MSRCATFEINRELNLGFTLHDVGRFRVNIFIQRSEVSMVIRYIKWDIPTIDELGAAAGAQGNRHEPDRPGAGGGFHRFG